MEITNQLKNIMKQKLLSLGGFMSHISILEA